MSQTPDPRRESKGPAASALWHGQSTHSEASCLLGQALRQCGGLFTRPGTAEPLQVSRQAGPSKDSSLGPLQGNQDSGQAPEPEHSCLGIVLPHRGVTVALTHGRAHLL